MEKYGLLVVKSPSKAEIPDHRDLRDERSAKLGGIQAWISCTPVADPLLGEPEQERVAPNRPAPGLAGYKPSDYRQSADHNVWK